MPHKTFGRPKHDEEELPREPISFDLADEEGLGVRSKVNGRMLLKVMGRVESDSTTEKVDALLSVFELVLLREDGENPEGYSGKTFDPEKPHKNHSEAELRELAAEGVVPGVDPTSSLGRVNRVLDDPDTEVEIDELVELVGWLIGEVSGGHPTKNAANSASGSKNTKSSSGRKRQPRALAGVPSDSTTA